MRNKYSAHHLLLLVVLGLLLFSGQVQAKPARKVLVFSKTAKFRHHAGIAAGAKAIQQLGTEHKFAVDVTEDAQVFTTDNLKQYGGSYFLKHYRRCIKRPATTGF